MNRVTDWLCWATGHIAYRRTEYGTHECYCKVRMVGCAYETEEFNQECLNLYRFRVWSDRLKRG